MDIFFAKLMELSSLRRTQAIQCRQAEWSSLAAFRMSFLVVRVLLRCFWVLGKSPTLQTPPLTLFIGLTISYLSGRPRNWGRLL